MAYLTMDDLGLGIVDPCAEFSASLAKRVASMQAAYARGDAAAGASEQAIVAELAFRLKECQQRTAAGQSPSPYVAPTQAEVERSGAEFARKEAAIQPPALPPLPGPAPALRPAVLAPVPKPLPGPPQAKPAADIVNVASRDLAARLKALLKAGPTQVEIPWGKVVIAGGAAAVLGGVAWYALRKR